MRDRSEIVARARQAQQDGEDARQALRTAACAAEHTEEYSVRQDMAAWDLHIAIQDERILLAALGAPSEEAVRRIYDTVLRFRTLIGSMLAACPPGERWTELGARAIDNQRETQILAWILEVPDYDGDNP